MKTWKRTAAGVLLFFAMLIPLYSGGSGEKNVSITLLETSDVHGVIAPWDYSADLDLDGGFAKIASLVKQERQKDPDLLLVDCGDTTQGNMVQEFRWDDIHPCIKALNAMRYDAWVLGNHEFNFEFETLLANIKNSKAAVLAGNIYKSDHTRFARPYIIKKVKGVRVGIIGVSAPHVPRWEASNPEHYDNMTFTAPDEEIGKILKEIEGKADVLVCFAHYGEDGEYDVAGMRDVAQKYSDKIAAFFIGHAHSTLNETVPGGAIIIEPGSNGTSVGKLSLNMKKIGKNWILVSKKGEILPIKGKNIAADPEFSSLMNYVHEESRALANTVVGAVGADFLPSLWWNNLEGIPTAIMQDTAMMDLINIVQLKETGADVSLAALFDAKSNLPKGPFRLRDGVKIYKYDNTLMAVKVTGKQMKAIMEERAGNFFNTYKVGDVTISVNPKIRLYNYDMFAGLDYDINISKPEGKRIENIMFKGSPLTDDQELVLAMNNYRYGGLVNANLISKDPAALTYNSGFAIRDLIGQYVIDAETIMPECDNNWRITGADLSHPAAATVYQLVRDGKIKIPTSEDGRTPNVQALNILELKAQGLLK